MKAEVSVVFLIIEYECFSEVLKLEGHGHTINMEVGVDTSHECTEAHVGLSLVPHSNQQRGGQVTHALAVPNRGVV